MVNYVFVSAVRRVYMLSFGLMAAGIVLRILTPAMGAPLPDPMKSPEAKALYESGLKAARKLLTAYDKQATGKREFLFTQDAESEFFESLRITGKEGVEAAEFVAQHELPLRKHDCVRHFWRPLIGYLDGPGFVWGRPHLNGLLRSDKVPDWTKTMIVTDPAEYDPEPANWLDEEAALPILQTLLSNNAPYAIREIIRDGDTVQRFNAPMRFCDQGVEVLSRIYKPADVKWIDADTTLPPAEADRQRNENVEAAKRWIEARLARLAARKELLEIASSYWRLNLTPGQIATVLDLWAGLETRNASGNIRDLNALANMLLADLKRTGDKPREDIEKDFHRAVHGRLASILGKAGFKPEGAENNLPANFNEEREWLRNATSKLARGASPDQWMRYEWEKYHDELTEAALDESKAASSSPPPSDGTTGKKPPAKPPVSVPKDSLWSP